MKLGVLTKVEAQNHPFRNVVTRALGSRGDPSVDLVEEPLEEGDTLLLCSTGPEGPVPDPTGRSPAPPGPWP